MAETAHSGSVEPPRNATPEEVLAALAGQPFREGVVYPLIGDTGYVYPDGTTVEITPCCADVGIPQGGTVDDYPCGILCTEPLDRAVNGMVRVGDCAYAHGHEGNHDPYPPHLADGDPENPVGPLAAYLYAARALRTEQARRFPSDDLGQLGAATYAAGWDAAADWLLHLAIPLKLGITVWTLDQVKGFAAQALHWNEGTLVTVPYLPDSCGTCERAAAYVDQMVRLIR